MGDARGRKASGIRRCCTETQARYRPTVGWPLLALRMLGAGRAGVGPRRLGPE